MQLPTLAEFAVISEFSSAGVQAQVKAIGEGRMAPPNARTKIGKELADPVASAYPNYDATCSSLSEDAPGFHVR